MSTPTRSESTRPGSLLNNARRVPPVGCMVAMLRSKARGGQVFRLQRSAGAWCSIYSGRALNASAQESCMSASSSKHSRHSHHYAARIAAWSGRHRKKAIWGWLGFVLVVFAVGNAVGTTNISDVDQFSGESHRAEQALDRAGMRPVEEVVFVQSDKLTVKDPEFRSAVGEITGRLTKMKYVSNVRSPLGGGGNVSADGHAALVKFVIAGDTTEARDRVDPSLAAPAAQQARTPSPA